MKDRLAKKKKNQKFINLYASCIHGRYSGEEKGDSKKWLQNSGLNSVLIRKAWREGNVGLFVVVQSFRHVQLFVTPWTAAHQASLSFTISWSLLRLMSIELVMPSNHLVLCCPLLLPSIFPIIRVFSSELILHIRWPKYWSFSFSISPSNEYSGLISFRIDGWMSLQSKGLKSLLQHHSSKPLILWC